MTLAEVLLQIRRVELAEDDDLESVLAAAADMKGKFGEQLRGNAGAARLSRQMATMRTDVNIGLAPRDIQISASLVAHVATMPEPKLVRTSPMGRPDALPAAAATLQRGNGRRAPRLRA